jgi:hypothetical protein
VILCGYPLPEHPGSRDEANDRGFDPDSIRHDRVTSEPLDDEWQAALEGSIEAARHLREDVCHVPSCGTVHCGTCGERLMCTGPEPRACGVTCVDCPCSCGKCIEAREDMRADLLHQLERESR